MNTMFKYCLLLFTCIIYASEYSEYKGPRIEKKCFGPYFGYYDNLKERYVIAKGDGTFVGIEDGQSLTNEQAQELFNELEMLYENQITPEPDQE